MANPQPGIQAPVPQMARYLSFSLKPGVAPRRALTNSKAWRTATNSWSALASRRC